MSFDRMLGAAKLNYTVPLSAKVVEMTEIQAHLPYRWTNANWRNLGKHASNQNLLIRLNTTMVSLGVFPSWTLQRHARPLRVQKRACTSIGALLSANSEADDASKLTCLLAQKMF